MIIKRQREFTSKGFKAIKRAKILEEIGTIENSGFLKRLKDAAKDKKIKLHDNIVAEKAVKLDRKLMKKGIEKSPLELSNAAAVSTQRQLARGGYVKSDVVPQSKPGKKGYYKGSKDGEIIDLYKEYKKTNPESANYMMKIKRDIREAKKRSSLK